MRTLLTLADVTERFPVSSSSVYDWMQEGTFPRPIKIGGRSYWIESELNDWLDSKVEERDRPNRRRRAPVKGRAA